jgi:hypothetical protein
MTMRVQAYFGVYGTRANIEQVERACGQYKFEVKELGAKRSAEQKASEPSRWLWRSMRLELDPRNIEAEVERLVGQIALLSAEWREAIAHAEERALTLIVQLDENEAPSGFSFSWNTVSGLSLLGAAFDVDYVTKMV